MDACGLVGEARTSITIGVAPGELSTYRGIGDLYSYNFADIQYPPAQDDDAFSFLGQGYRPLISPPAHLRSLDPLWSNCNLGPFQGNDPPRALSPVAAMDPMTTAVDPVAIHQQATPASVPPLLPTITDSASKPADPNPSVVSAAADPSRTVYPSPYQFRQIRPYPTMINKQQHLPLSTRRLNRNRAKRTIRATLNGQVRGQGTVWWIPRYQMLLD